LVFELQGSSRRVASVDGEVTADNSVMTAATATGACLTRTTVAGTTIAAYLHCPVAAATGGHRGRNGLAPAEHHVRAVWRRLHPHAPCTCLGLATDRNVLCNGASRAPPLHEARVIKAIAARHVIGVLLSKRVEWGAVGVARVREKRRRAQNDE
jgi:hypothetical protein